MSLWYGMRERYSEELGVERETNMRSSVVLFETLYYTLPLVGRVSVWQVGVVDYVQRQHQYDSELFRWTHKVDNYNDKETESLCFCVVSRASWLLVVS